MTTAVRPAIKPSLRRFMGLSLAEGERHLSGTVLRSYCAVWEWASPKMGGPVADKHHEFWVRYGKTAYYARINKVRAACGFPLIVV
jgi:hypothetical protein